MTRTQHLILKQANFINWKIARKARGLQNPKKDEIILRYPPRNKLSFEEIPLQAKALRRWKDSRGGLSQFCDSQKSHAGKNRSQRRNQVREEMGMHIKGCNRKEEQRIRKEEG